MPRKRQMRPSSDSRLAHDDPDSGPGTVRIVGGTFRGRKLPYAGDQRTRPMKDRVREAVFNLVNTSAVGAHAIDLFAGTGALGIEALSRGAARATMIEQHFPTADQIRENLRLLGAEDRATVVGGDTFYWAKKALPTGAEPLLVFVSPPYEFYQSRQAEMLQLIGDLLERSPAGSTFVVEADERFDMRLLPQADQWQVRTYPPAVVALCRKTSDPAPAGEPAS